MTWLVWLIGDVYKWTRKSRPGKELYDTQGGKKSIVNVSFSPWVCEESAVDSEIIQIPVTLR